MTGGVRIVEGQPLASVADPRASGTAFEYLRDHRPACHSDTGEALIDSAEGLGDCVVFSPSFRQLQYVALITRGTIFAIGFGQRGVAYRLPPDLIATALATGAEPAPAIGADWVQLELFRADFPRPDLGFWTIKAYAAARG